MKRIGNLYDTIAAPESLVAAYEDARKRKRATNSCYRFERNLGANILGLADALKTGTYRPDPYHTFEIFEPKRRVIYAPSFRDRVVQHSIYRAIQPAFDATFIDQSFACRPGKGTHAASDYVQSALRSAPRDSYYLQLDIRRYYYSLDRRVLRSLIERKIKDQKTVELIMLFAEHDSPLGVPIGNLLSQLFGLIYLNPLDHYIKRELLVGHYARYVDDFILIGITKEQAVDYRAAVMDYLCEHLHLELSKAIIAPVRRGSNFVGYRTWSSRRFVRKRALYTFRKSAKRGRLDSIISGLGHAQHTASWASMIHYLQDDHNDLYLQLPQSVHAMGDHRNGMPRRLHGDRDDR